MTPRLPRGEEAVLDIAKIEEYCLSSTHPRGRHKARVFHEVLGLRREDASWLRLALLDAARSGEAFQIAQEAWGTRWRMDVTLRRQERVPW